MKNKNELRWLMFMLIPFVIFLIIHFLVPLMFLLNANPIVEESYNNERIKLEQNSVRSLAILNS
jgi:hypothetical protein